MQGALWRFAVHLHTASFPGRTAMFPEQSSPAHQHSSSVGTRKPVERHSLLTEVSTTRLGTACFQKWTRAQRLMLTCNEFWAGPSVKGVSVSTRQEGNGI